MSALEKTPAPDGAPADFTHPHHPDLVTTGDGGVVLASEADAELLAKMGYKQELKRNFSTLEVFGIAFSIMGLLPSIASTLAFSLPSGPAGMVWSWFLASGCIFLVGLAMADLGSAMPTSGGLYWWTHYFGSPKTRNYLCFLVGYSNSLGLVGGLCSINCKFFVTPCRHTECCATRADVVPRWICTHVLRGHRDLDGWDVVAQQRHSLRGLHDMYPDAWNSCHHSDQDREQASDLRSLHGQSGSCLLVCPRSAPLNT